MQRLSSLLLITPSFMFLFSCNATSPPPLSTSLFMYRFNPPALVEFSEDFQTIDEIRFSIPPHCGLFNIFSAPAGHFLAVELSCPNGQTVLFLDSNTAAVNQPVPDSDSHFLAWNPDGKAAYLKVDSLGTTRIVGAYTDGTQDLIPITELTYDLVPSPKDGEFMFAFSRGLGQGSELWLARRNGKHVEPLYADAFNYISFARYSPDGSQIAFIKIPDAQTPFTVGELWVMDSDGLNPRKLADADAGHGYAANWSPDGTRIAFVFRENPEDAIANESSEALIGNIDIVEVESGKSSQVTNMTDGHVETPLWVPDGNTLAFNVVIDDRIDVQIADLSTGEIRFLIREPACCPAWVRK